MFQKFLDNVKHVPTTVVGAAGIAAVIIQDPTLQAVASVNPKIAAVLSTVGSIATGLMLIFGAGKTRQDH